MVLDVALPERVLGWAQEQVPAAIVEVGPIGGGLTRTKWLLRLADSEQLVLRWCDPLQWGDIGGDHVRRETLACALLAGSVLPVPRLVTADVEGSQAGGPANLVTWLPGAIRTVPPGPASIEALAELAVSVHSYSVDEERRPPAFSYRGPVDLEVPGWTTRPLLWQRAIDLRDAGAPDTPFGLLHRDFHFGNILWQGEFVSGLIDWAELSWGPADLDVAHLCSDFAMLHTRAGAEAFRAAYLRHGGRLDPAAARYWQVSDILGFLPDPGHILPAVAPGHPDLTVAGIRAGLEDLLASTLD